MLLVNAAMLSPAERFGGWPVSYQLVLQVFGHEDIKRAVLLMLFGGVHKQTREVSLPSMTVCSSTRHHMLPPEDKTHVLCAGQVENEVYVDGLNPAAGWSTPCLC